MSKSPDSQTSEANFLIVIFSVLTMLVGGQISQGQVGNQHFQEVALRLCLALLSAPFLLREISIQYNSGQFNAV